VTWERWRREAPERWEVQEERHETELRNAALDRGIDNAVDSFEALTIEVQVEREKVEVPEQLLADRRELLGELSRLAAREREATASVRKAERALAAERAKPAPEPDDGHRRRPGRLVRVLADDGAWRVVRAEAERQHMAMGSYLALLVITELADDTDRSLAPIARRRRSPGEGEPSRTPHALRVFITEDHWTELRVTAAALNLRLGAYVGQLAEAEAFRLGWRC